MGVMTKAPKGIPQSRRKRMYTRHGINGGESGKEKGTKTNEGEVPLGEKEEREDNGDINDETKEATKTLSEEAKQGPTEEERNKGKAGEKDLSEGTKGAELNEAEKNDKGDETGNIDNETPTVKESEKGEIKGNGEAKEPNREEEKSNAGAITEDNKGNRQKTEEILSEKKEG